MNLGLATAFISMSAVTAQPACPVVTEAEKPKSPTHQPDHEKAEVLEALGRGYEVMWKATGKKCYKDSMDACFGDAKDYRTCGFVRPLGATL